MVSACLLCKTSALDTDVSIHTFPKDSERRLLWLKAVNKTNVNKNARLCSKHFESRFYRYGIVEHKRFLISTAVPTLYLCNDKENIKESKSIEEKCKLDEAQNPVLDQDPVHNKTEGDASKIQGDSKEIQGDIDRHDGVKYKRMKYIGDVDWNVVSQIPSEAKYYGMLAVEEVKALRKELNVRGQKIRNMNKKISNLQSLLTNLKEKNLIDDLNKETLSPYRSQPRTEAIITRRRSKSH